MQLLGLGVNGHIGFNEPADAFSTGTHQVTLTESTRDANKRFFASIDEVPTHARTMGVRDIMQARKVLMVANGAAKAQAIRDAGSPALLHCDAVQAFLKVPFTPAELGVDYLCCFG